MFNQFITQPVHHHWYIYDTCMHNICKGTLFLNSSHSICNSFFERVFSGLDGYLLWLIMPVFTIFYYPLHSVDPNDQKKTACYDIDVEVEDPLKGQMSSFLLSTANQQEITALDNKVLPQYHVAYIYTSYNFLRVWCRISKGLMWERDCSFRCAFKGWISHISQGWVGFAFRI